MQALGLIETKGLLAAIEAADTMVKSADVSIIEKTYVGGGLVTISVTGDVGAVKASVEAGTSAVKKLDAKLLVSEHVIPRPHEEVGSIIGPNTPPENPSSNEDSKDTENKETVEKTEDTKVLEKAKDTANVENRKTIDNVSKIKETEYEKKIKSVEKKDNDETVETVENVKGSKTVKDIDGQEAKNKIKENQDELHKVNLENLHKEDVDNLVRKNGLEKTVLMLAKLKVVKLRNLAREYKDFVITGRTISKAGKNSLITKFKLYYEKN